MRYSFEVLLLFCIEVGAQPQIGPYTLLTAENGHYIRSPKICVFADTLTTAFWVDESANEFIAYRGIIRSSGALSDVIEIARCAPPNQLVVESAHDNRAALSMRHDDSFDLFVVIIDDGNVDSVFIASEMSGFEEGFGVLPTYPEEVVLKTDGWVGWSLAWATARLAPVTHVWLSSPNAARYYNPHGLSVTSFGDTIPSEVFSSPSTVWRGGDTLFYRATARAADGYGYATYDPIGHGIDLDTCNKVVRCTLQRPIGWEAKFVSQLPDDPNTLLIRGEGGTGPCHDVGAATFPRVFDVMFGLWWWGYAGLTISNDELWIESADDLGGSIQRANPLSRATQASQLFEADLTITLSGYIETLWTESVDNQDFASVLKWSAVSFHDPLVPEHEVSLPNEFSFSAYPNPFNSTVRIDYELPQTSDVELTVHNTLGQEVATLHSGRAQAGTHSVNWSPDVASGVYFVKLASAEFTTSRKILYVR